MPYFAWQKSPKGLAPVMIWMLTNSKMSDDIVKKYELTDEQIKGKTLEDLAREFPPPPQIQEPKEPTEHIKQRNELAERIAVALNHALSTINDAKVEENVITLTDMTGVKWTVVVAKKRHQ